MCFVVGNEIDFRSNRLTVAFQRGVVMQNVSIPIINDDIVEEMENFSLSIQVLQRFLAIGIRQGTPATAIGFIIDDDGITCIYIHACISLSGQKYPCIYAFVIFQIIQNCDWI